LPIGRKYIDNWMLGLKIGSYRSNSRLCILFNPGVIEFVCGGFSCQGTSVPGQHVWGSTLTFQTQGQRDPVYVTSRQECILAFPWNDFWKEWNNYWSLLWNKMEQVTRGPWSRSRLKSRLMFNVNQFSPTQPFPDGIQFCLKKNSSVIGILVHKRRTNALSDGEPDTSRTGNWDLFLEPLEWAKRGLVTNGSEGQGNSQGMPGRNVCVHTHTQTLTPARCRLNLFSGVEGASHDVDATFAWKLVGLECRDFECWNFEHRDFECTEFCRPDDAGQPTNLRTGELCMAFEYRTPSNKGRRGKGWSKRTTRSRTGASHVEFYC